MTIREVERGGKTVLVIDIVYRDKEGKKRRYRRDAQVQTKTAAREEEKRLVASLVTTGFIGGSPVTAEDRARAGAAGAKPPDPAPISFRAALDAFGVWGRAHLKHSTRVGYQEIVETYLEPRFSDRPLAELDGARTTEILARMDEEGLSISRKRNVLVVVRSIWKAAIAMGLAKEAPSLPPLPRLGKTELSLPTPQEVERLVAAAKKAYAKLPLLLGIYAGLRTGEVRALRWKDVDLGRRQLVVREALVDGVYDRPKSGHDRVVPVDPSGPLFALLASVERGEPGEHVCKTMGGEVWGENGLWQMIRRHCLRAKIPHARFHATRHAFVTGLFRAGVSAPVVQRLAGHHSLAVTQRYAHTTRDEAQRAIALLSGTASPEGSGLRVSW
jgi:integrase